MTKWIRFARKGRGIVIYTDGSKRIIISKIKDSKWLLETKPKGTKQYFLSRNSAEFHAVKYMLN